jgi:hypothetical protein
VTFRDDAQALASRVEMLEHDLERALLELEQTRAALSSVLADLDDRAPSDDVPWRSIQGGAPIRVRVGNHGEDKVELRWVGYDGRERKETTLIPGGERELETQVAHLWRMVDPHGRVVLQRYVRASDPRLVREP